MLYTFFSIFSIKVFCDPIEHHVEEYTEKFTVMSIKKRINPLVVLYVNERRLSAPQRMPVDLPSADLKEQPSLDVTLERHPMYTIELGSDRRELL